MSARLSFDHELELLNTDLIKMGALVEDAITKSIEALKTSNHDMARVHYFYIFYIFLS